jgi:hypothetical protein
VSAHLRVPKRRIQAEAALAGRPPLHVELFLAEINAHVQRPERISDLLDGDQPFLPVLEDGKPSLLGRSALLWVAVDNSVLDEDELELFSFRRDITIDFNDGTSIGGELLYTAPSDNARVADYLNGRELCFRVWSTSRTYFVIKHHVARVREV